MVAPESRWGGWDWLPDRSLWFEGVQARARAWTPPPALGLAAGPLAACIAQAAARHEPWLAHPCMGVLLANAAPLPAHARLAVWVAANAPASVAATLGELSLPHATCVWTKDGPCELAAGRYVLASFATASGLPDVLAIPDPWGDSLPDPALVGDLAEAAWWERPPLSQAAESELAADIHTLLVLQRLFAGTLPAAAQWMREVARVVVPLARGEGQEFRSGSIAGVPGLVFVEITRRQLLVLEALVHESAHLHFHLAEFDNDFIEAGHDGRYASPLRRDPRPLRGIFLAYHALLYMCAFYKDWQAGTGDERAGEARGPLRRQRDAAAEVLCGARAHLSAPGQDFLAHCLACAEEDDRR